MFNQMVMDRDMLVDGVISLVYFMRGSMSYEEMMRRTAYERDRINEFILDRLETQKNSPYPVY